MPYVSNAKPIQVGIMLLTSVCYIVNEYQSHSSRLPESGIAGLTSNFTVLDLIPLVPPEEEMAEILAANNAAASVANSQANQASLWKRARPTSRPPGVQTSSNALLGR